MPSDESQTPLVSKLKERGLWTADFKSLTAMQKILRLFLFLMVLPSLVTVLVLLSSWMTLQKLPKMTAIWIVYCVPLVACVFAWIGFYRHAHDGPDRFPKASAMVLTTTAVLVAVGQATYVQFVGDLDLRVWGDVLGLMLLLSFAGFVVGLVTVRAPRWFSVLALFAANWLLVLSCLYGMAF